MESTTTWSEGLWTESEIIGGIVSIVYISSTAMHGNGNGNGNGKWHRRPFAGCCRLFVLVDRHVFTAVIRQTRDVLILSSGAA